MLGGTGRYWWVLVGQQRRVLLLPPGQPLKVPPIRHRSTCLGCRFTSVSWMLEGNYGNDDNDEGNEDDDSNNEGIDCNNEGVDNDSYNEGIDEDDSNNDVIMRVLI